MRLPEKLSATIEQLLAGVRPADLARAAEEISRTYRDPQSSGQKLTTELHRLAYLAVRLPATYAAIHAVVRELQLHNPDFTPMSMLDLGAGPGTASLAAATVFPDLKRSTLVERDQRFVAHGRRLLAGTPLDATWHGADMTDGGGWPIHDLVVIAYSAGEMGEVAWLGALAAAWRSTGEVLAVIEPGSAAGYETILVARDWLLAKGAHAVAPCPHAGACPMQGTRDWCHFATRVERTSLHRRAKGAELPYEDEKYSYFIAARKPVSMATARIVARPDYGKGHLRLRLCTAEGLKTETVSKKQTHVYRAARKAEWGDAWSGVQKFDPE